MKQPPRFKIRILSPVRCEVLDENSGSCEEFASLKAVMDFVNMVDGAHVTIAVEAGAHQMRMVLPKPPSLHAEAVE